jgi:polyisoprenyl-teichoic acid--peptidoglycan teichoic acid transferase
LAAERGAWWRGFALGLTLVLSALLLGGGALLLLSGAPPRAVLLVGVDERPDEQQRGQFGHTDTIAVLGLPAAGGAALVSFPRDLWVDIPDYGPQRLNVAYPLGAQQGGAAGGAAVLQRTLARAFGLSANRWATVDFRGFVALVDALGGVELTVPRALVDDTYPTDDYGTRRLEIPAGAQHMNGEQALAYVRTRAADSDFGRMARQQQVLVALRDQALTPAGIVRWPAAALVLPRTLKTDLGPGEALAIARVLLLLPRDQVRALVIGPDLAPPQVGPGGAAILLPRETAIRQALAETLDPPRRAVSRQ